MENGIFTLNWASIFDAVVTAAVTAVIVGAVNLVATTGFDVFTADWLTIGKHMTNLAFIAGVVSLGRDFLTAHNGSVLGITPPKTN